MKLKENKTYKFHIGQQSTLISKAASKAGSVRNLSINLRIPERTLKHYKAEDFTIPSLRLQQLVDYLQIQSGDISKMIKKELPRHWGSRLGGLKTYSKKNRKDLLRDMNYIRSFKKPIIYDKKFPLTNFFCEFYGILMGDGCISSYTDYQGNRRLDLIITGDKRYEMAYYQYMKKRLREEFNINSYIYQLKKRNSVRLTIRNKYFSNFLINFGFPKGNKYKVLRIPPQIMKFKWEKLKFVIRGLFDTDGSIFANKNEGYRYPYICITSISGKLLNQLYGILRARGYPVYLSNDNLFMRGIANVNKWMNDVGSSNPKHKFKYNYWTSKGVLPARLLSGP